MGWGIVGVVWSTVWMAFIITAYGDGVAGASNQLPCRGLLFV